MDRPIVITGGGTGGHVFPMQAVAEELLAAGVRAADLRFVGSRRGQERNLLATMPIAQLLLPGRGLRRSWRAADLVRNVLSVLSLISAVIVATISLARWRARAVVSLGGYAAAPAVAAAVLTRRPLVLIDLDAAPGAVHRLSRRWATVVCTAFASSDPRSVLTGAPLRRSLTSLTKSSREPAAPWTVVVMTGSLGARSVNRATLELATLWRQRPDVRLLHVTGRRDAQWCAQQWQPQPDDRLHYEQITFGDMVQLWSVADVAVCRAGATTIAELTFLGIPSVLVPLPGAPGDHQTHNALAVVQAGGAVLLVDRDLNGDAVAAALTRICEPATWTTMSAAARSLGRGDAAAAIAREILRVAS